MRTRSLGRPDTVPQPRRSLNSEFDCYLFHKTTFHAHIFLFSEIHVLVDFRTRSGAVGHEESYSGAYIFLIPVFVNDSLLKKANPPKQNKE